MKLIAGLGNPGRIYAGSRHNVGFSVVKALSSIHKIPLKKDKGGIALTGVGRIGRQKVILALPLTFMNLSGISLRNLVRQHRMDPHDLLVVCDDLDLEMGRLKIRPCGSSGGHRGIGSIIEALGREDFARLRIGIGRPVRMEPSEFVLSAFTRREVARARQMIEDACACCNSWVTQGITKTMNIFNKRSQDNE